MRRALLVIAGGVLLGWLAAYLEDYWRCVHAPTQGWTPEGNITYHSWRYPDDPYPHA